VTAALRWGALAASSLVIGALLGTARPWHDRLVGLVLAPAMNIATLGVRAEDAGVASAMVNTMQQVGGSIGTALLSTLAASAASSYAATNQASVAALSEAAVHGYTTAFWWAAGIFAAGALVSALLLRGPAPELEPGAEPAAVPAAI
jgi:hypothetical protein